MDERVILLAQVSSLHRNLCRVAELLALSPAEGRLHALVSDRIDRLLRRQRLAAEDTREKVRRGDPLPECWDTFRGVRQQSEPIFAECLAFLEGALLRRAGADDGICRVADVMLSDLSKRAGVRWERFTILATREFFANMAEIIRLRFPENTVWHLPVAVHEFGHFVAHDLQRSDIFGDSFRQLLRREEAKGPRQARHFQEFFADVFATYAMGPAYPCACVMLRFDPGTARLDSQTHPGDAKRVHLLLRALQRMDTLSGGGLEPYQNVADRLGGLWERSLSANMQLTHLDPDVTASLDEMFDELFKVMLTELRAAACYDGWLRAQALFTKWRPETGEVPEPDEYDTLSDVVNAAWLWRLYHDGEGELTAWRVNEKALKMCERIVARDETSGLTG